MNFYEYESSAASTAVYPREDALSYVALGLVGEAGEVANKVKKVLRDRGGEVDEDMREDLISELGDVLWYVAACCRELNVDMATVAYENTLKLANRKMNNTLQGAGDKR